MSFLSIYDELLDGDTSDSPIGVFPIDMIGYGDEYDECDEYDDSEHDKDQNTNTTKVFDFENGNSEIIELPTIKYFLTAGQRKYVVRDLELCTLNYPVNKELLKEYTDGWLLNEYPSAARFTINEDDYQELLNCKTSIGYNGKRNFKLEKFGYGYHTIFKDGFILKTNKHSSQNDADNCYVIVTAIFKNE